jgi:hypothetical protein
VSRAACLAAAVLTIFFFRSAPASDEHRILDVLNAAFDAQRAADFNRLVLLVHPQTQHLFRDILSARTDLLLRSYSQGEISAVSGLPAHPKDLSLSDSEFFAFTCYNTKARHPDFTGDTKYFQFTLEGTTFDTYQRAHVVLSWPGSVHTERTDYNSIGSVHVFLKQEQSQWLLWSVPFAQKIGDLWCRDLATSRQPDQYLR